jgi:hypothetical protein
LIYVLLDFLMWLSKASPNETAFPSSPSSASDDENWRHLKARTMARPSPAERWIEQELEPRIVQVMSRHGRSDVDVQT